MVKSRSSVLTGSKVYLNLHLHKNSLEKLQELAHLSYPNTVTGILYDKKS